MSHELGNQQHEFYNQAEHPPLDDPSDNYQGPSEGLPRPTSEYVTGGLDDRLGAHPSEGDDFTRSYEQALALVKAAHAKQDQQNPVSSSQGVLQPPEPPPSQQARGGNISEGLDAKTRTRGLFGRLFGGRHKVGPNNGPNSSEADGVTPPPSSPSSEPIEPSNSSDPTASRWASVPKEAVKPDSPQNGSSSLSHGPESPVSPSRSSNVSASAETAPNTPNTPTSPGTPTDPNNTRRAEHGSVQRDVLKYKDNLLSYELSRKINRLPVPIARYDEQILESSDTGTPELIEMRNKFLQHQELLGNKYLESAEDISFLLTPDRTTRVHEWDGKHLFTASEALKEASCLVDESGSAKLIDLPPLTVWQVKGKYLEIVAKPKIVDVIGEDGVRHRLFVVARKTVYDPGITRSVHFPGNENGTSDVFVYDDSRKRKEQFSVNFFILPDDAETDKISVAEMLTCSQPHSANMEWRNDAVLSSGRFINHNKVERIICAIDMIMGRGHDPLPLPQEGTPGALPVSVSSLHAAERALTYAVRSRREQLAEMAAYEAAQRNLQNAGQDLT